ncbi:regulator of chromosome condensation 1/beta-lactamase-inhibitor protein II [Naematelia encephala]|uniref:Regulator of chromosome condensation 1/beta-lactamase-inhibitor protein II n=1 Tax=Naematelia encephala TaxID=71784 RepID=A0A1Y2B4L3_9TREE|nr:regulator of chromosome condensation 1/beta-lactamase-inhibitor protein II [Naematelia encephala]
MPPKRTAATPSVKPPSRATAKPASKAAATKPVSSAKPASRRRVSAVATPAPTVPTEVPIAENGDVDMAAPSEKPKLNGNAVVNGNGDVSKKRGRVGELAGELAGEEKKARRRSSLGMALKNPIPQPPPSNGPPGTVFVWGTGDNGQNGLGPDELDEIPRPRLQTWLDEQQKEGKLGRDGKGGIETLACGGMHTLAIDEAGRVRSWGINDNAALGRITVDVPDPNNPDSKIPNEDLETYPFVIEALEKEGFRAVQVDAGDSVSVAVSDKGEVRAWGSFRSNDGVLGFDGVPGHSPFQFNPMPLHSLQKAKVQVVQVSCGADHVLALTTTGHVYVWGNGQQSQLGRRIMERRKLNGLEPERLGLRNITYVSTGTYHSFAVDASGTVWAWGLNTFRQTGVADSRGGEEDMISIPTQVDSLHPDEHNGAKVVQISGGEHHTIFLFDNGEVWGCGRCDAHQIGIAEDHPAFQGVLARRKAMQQAKAEKLDAALGKLEQAKKEGDEEKQEAAEQAVGAAQANLHAALDEYIPEPVRICFPPIPETYEIVPDFPTYSESSPSDNPIADIAAGTRHNLAVSRSGHVYSWGLGIQAQLGLGQQESAEVPTLVRSKWLKPYTAIKVSAGGQHCALVARLREANGA